MDTLTYHNWHIDSSQLDLSFVRFVALDSKIHNTLFQTLDCIKPVYQRLYLALPSSYFLFFSTPSPLSHCSLVLNPGLCLQLHQVQLSTSHSLYPELVHACPLRIRSTLHLAQ